MIVRLRVWRPGWVWRYARLPIGGAQTRNERPDAAEQRPLERCPGIHGTRLNGLQVGCAELARTTPDQPAPTSETKGKPGQPPGTGSRPAARRIFGPGQAGRPPTGSAAVVTKPTQPACKYWPPG